MSQPPGHIPGFHAPGTVVPIPWILEQQQAQTQAVERDDDEARTRLLLLLLNR
jgi:hypothetical protein